MRKLRALRVAVTVGLVGAVMLAGCGNDDGDSTSAETTTTAAAETTTTSGAETTTTTAAETTTAEQADSAEAELLATAESFIDAFYSYDPSSLDALLEESLSADFVLYYQGWAEGANYEVLERMACVPTGTNSVSCSITVRDDLSQTLEYGFDVTDTFAISFFPNGAIASVDVSGDDPPIIDEAFDWVFTNKPELFEGVCEGFFEGGPTPQECARAVVDAFEEFVETQE